MKCFVLFFTLIIYCGMVAKAQDTTRVMVLDPRGNNASSISDTLMVPGTITVTADPRLAMMQEKIKAFASSALAGKKVSQTGFVQVVGYRLMVLNTTDRDLLSRTRTSLLQAFPDQQPYQVFQAPFTKLKFGDFVTRQEAESYRKQIVSMKIVSNNIYIVSEKVIVKAERLMPDAEK